MPLIVDYVKNAQVFFIWLMYSLQFVWDCEQARFSSNRKISGQAPADF